MDVLTRLGHEALNRLSEQARQSPRLRANLNLHNKLEDPVQRFFNAMEPGTYVRPHRHTEADKWELFLLVRGSALVILFNDGGEIHRRIMLSNATNIVIEIPPNTWHAVVSLEENTVLYESKRGPYVALSDKDFATWAPQEGEENVDQFIDWYINGEIGSKVAS